MDESNVRRFRWVMGFFLVALLFSGATALPLLTEMRVGMAALQSSGLVATDGSSVLLTWLQTVQAGLEEVNLRHPWMAYGTDWLAFGHFAIALFFIGAWRDPAHSRMVLQAGVAACVLVVPFALLAGAVRGIPWWWRLIDCSFGVVGLVPLLYCLRLVPQADRQIAEPLTRPPARPGSR